MNVIVKGIEPQPSFPEEDLSDANREMITLLLLNAALVENGHRAAEATSWVFRASHPAITQGISRVYDDDKVTAVSHGVSIFESTSAFVGVAHCTDDVEKEFVVSRNAVLFARAEEPYVVNARVDQAVESFRANMPNMSEVTLEISQRFYGHLAGYALLGAALARDFLKRAG